jgi:hypothetical protein
MTEYEQGFSNGIEKAMEIVKGNEMWGQASKMLQELDALRPYHAKAKEQCMADVWFTFDESDGWRDQNGKPA